MYIYKKGKRVEIWSPAKINLFLEILHRRMDGFHEIETLMVPIDLFDTLTGIADQGEAIDLTVSAGSDSSEALPAVEDNLVYKALDLLRSDAGCKHGISVHLNKRIPSMAGLGGGSSDAAAALVLGNSIWGLGYSNDRLVELAAQLGSDVPFFLFGSTCVCRGRGEIISVVKRMPRMDFVIVRPAEGLSTAAVFRETTTSHSNKLKSIEPIIRLISTNRPHLLGNLLFNRLQAAATGLLPSIKRISDRLSRLDVLGHRMSGSGSTYFAVCRNRIHAQRIAKTLRSQGMGTAFAVSSAGLPNTNSLTYRPSQN